VRDMIASVIETAKSAGKPIGICGQAPSDYPEFARWLVEQGINSISLNPDAAIKTQFLIAAVEKKLTTASEFPIVWPATRRIFFANSNPGDLPVTQRAQ